MTLASMGARPRCLEELRIGGGYASAPDGGVDIDKAGNIASDGDLSVNAVFAEGDLNIGGSGEIDGNLKVHGALEVGGGTTDKGWSRFLSSKADGWPRLSGGCSAPVLIELRPNIIETYVLDFDKDTPEYAVFQTRLPLDYDGSVLKIGIMATATSGSSGVARFALYAAAFHDGDNLDSGALASIPISLNFAAQKELMEGAGDITPENAGGGGLLHLLLMRQATHALDTFDADIRVLGLHISYA